MVICFKNPRNGFNLYIMKVISEDHIEQLMIQKFINLGYTHLRGPNISPGG